MPIVQEGFDSLEAYGSIPIAFTIRSRIRLDALIESSGRTIVEEPVQERPKDYDSFTEERPSSLASRFDLTKWGILAAFEVDQRIGGAIVAYGTPEYELLGGRPNAAALVDMRVHPDWQGRGVGKALFEEALKWSRSRGAETLIVETQDTNVAACRFYRAMGCELESADPNGYGDELDEAKLIWRIRV